MLLPPGTRLGPYEIQSIVGAGGMGEVYRGRDVRLQRGVAIKVIASSRADDSAIASRFAREAQVLAAPNHRCCSVKRLAECYVRSPQLAGRMTL
jgi:eukaryotic-like serine/threonine-protein kinase